MRLKYGPHIEYVQYRKFLERCAKDMSVWNEACNEILEYACSYPNCLISGSYPIYSLETVKYVKVILAERILLGFDIP